MTPPGRQLRLDLAAPALGRADFLTGAANAEAVAHLDDALAWPKAALALVGPAGVGKSHLAAVWAAEAGAERLASDTPSLRFPPPGRPVLLEDADRGADDHTLFHLLNRAALGEGALLLTARAAPSTWACTLPDLRSRLNALAVAQIAEPDDDLLAALLAKAFAERIVTPSPELLRYLLRRIERSAASARATVARLEAASADGRIGLSLARRVLEEEEEETAELFPGATTQGED